MTGNSSTPFQGETALRFDPTTKVLGNDIAEIQINNDNSATKIKLWGNTSSYAIGMVSGITYGFLNDYATVFQMNNDADRGWIFRPSTASASQGAMSLTTDGRLYVDQNVQAPNHSFPAGGNISSDGSTMRFTF